MGKSKLIKRSKFLIAGAVAGCVAGSVQAATPPAAPSVPTAPPPPAYQYESSAGYPTGTNAFYSPGNSAYSPYHQGAFTLKPAQESPSPAGGYLLIRNTPEFEQGATQYVPTPPPVPSGASYYVPYSYQNFAAFGPFSPTGAYISNQNVEYYGATIAPQGGGTSIESFQALVSSGPISIPVLGNANVGDFTVGNGGYPINISQEITVEPGAASSLGWFSADSGYTAPNSYLTGQYEGFFSVGDGGYGWVKVTGTLNTLGNSESLGVAQTVFGGNGGTYVGNGGPPFHYSSPEPVGGNGPNQTDVNGFMTDPVPIAPQEHANLGGPANGTGYGIVNVDGGTWNNSNGALQIGFGSQGFVTVDSGGSINLNNTPMIVGQDFPHSGGSYIYSDTGVGTVVVSNGSLTSTGAGGYIVLGRSTANYASTGRMYLTGSGSRANISSWILVGGGGYGFLAIEKGASIISAAAYSASAVAQPGSGNIVIDGVSSSWTISGNGDFGESGVATATVQNHGDLNISGTLTLGDQSTGSGTLSVQADGTVESGDATLGNQAGATGFANVSNINTLWTVDGDLTIGNSGQGTLTLSNNGEVVTTGAGILGSQSGSTGTATITDAGTEWQINGELKVGDKGNATMQLENGGYVSLAGNLAIADSGGTSTLTLDGNGSRLIVGGTSVTIGGQGDGTLTVQNAADAVFSGASVSLGEKSSGTGTLTVEGSNTIMSTGSLTIGGYGTGTVNVQDSAALSTATNISLGEQASGIGTATIDSAAVTDAGTLTVGGYGTGTMTIQNSGSLTVQGNSVTLGEQAGGSGTMNIIGNGSSLVFSGDLTVGESGSGDFELQNGGQFGGVSMTVGAGSGFGGASTGGAGTVEISGAGSSLSLSQDLTVGKYGQGTITLAGGGSLIDQGDVTLGSVTASNGTVNVNTGSIWMLSGGLTIGSKGYGTVVVNGASNLKSTGDSITVGKQGAGELTVSGNQSLLTYTGDLAIGDEATGTLNVQSGAGIQYSGNTSNVDIAETAGITGTVTVTDSGSTMAADNLVLAGKSSGSGGTGILNVENGGVLAVANDMTMWKNASLNVTGGSITVGTVGSGTAPLNTLQVNTSGNLAAGGTLTGNLVNNQGVIALGKILPESLNITGGFSQSGGTLKVLIAGSSDFSQLNATGAVNISGGTIEFDFINGFAPKSGETFQFLDPPQAVNFANTAYTFTGLASGFTFGVNSDANGLLFTALSNGVATTSPIPEPATLALLAMAGAGMLLLRKRRGFVKR